MAKRKIILTGATMQTFSKSARNNVVLGRLTVYADFDQLVAEALGIKDAVYDDSGMLRRGIRNPELDITYFGPGVKIVPAQRDLYNQTDGHEITPVQIDGLRIRQPKDENKIRLMLRLTFANEACSPVDDAFEALKSDELNLVIQAANKEREQAAVAIAAQFGLFKAKSEDEGGEDEDGEEVEDAEDEDAEENDEVLAGNQTLASRSAMKRREGARAN